MEMELFLLNFSGADGPPSSCCLSLARGLNWSGRSSGSLTRCGLVWTPCLGSAYGHGPYIQSSGVTRTVASQWIVGGAGLLPLCSPCAARLANFSDDVGLVDHLRAWPETGRCWWAASCRGSCAQIGCEGEGCRNWLESNLGRAVAGWVGC